MSQATLTIAALFSLASALVYGMVGFQFARRRVSPDAREAQYAFAVWWIALAASSLIGGALRLMGAFGNTQLVVHFTATYLNLWLICVALAGLLYYLLYLFTGSRAWLWVVVVAYLALFLSLLWIFSLAEPTGVTVGRWSTELQLAREFTAGVTYVFLVLLVGPAMLGSVGYLSLARKLKSPEARFRAIVVPLILISWFGSSIVASVVGLSQVPWWPLVSGWIGLVAAILIYFAYDMPGWVARRIGRPGDPTSPA